MEDSQNTQNIQINIIIGENEKCIFYFTEKKTHTNILANPMPSVSHVLDTMLAAWNSR